MSDFRTRFREFSEEQLELLPPFNGGDGMVLDPHQVDAMTALCLGMDEKRDAYSIVQSCGSGKTILEANLLIASQRAKQLLGTKNTQDVIITTERALLESIREQLTSLGLDVGVWGNGRRETDRPTVLTSIQSLQTSTRREISHSIPFECVDLLIGDEADAYLTRQRRDVISLFRKALKIGLTATPTWPDGRNISEVWGEIVHCMPLREGILNGVNVPPLYYLFETEIDESELDIEAGDYDRKTLEAALREAEIHRSISQMYEMLIPIEQRKSYPTMVFVPSVSLVCDVVETLRERFQPEGVSVQGWTGASVSTAQMREDIAAFNNGNLDILVLCEMGGRGLDLPPARFLIDAYPTLSPTKLEQRHGRVSRRIRNDTLNRKSFSLIAQLVPSSNRFRPYLLPDLLDCWDDFRERRLLAYRPRPGIQNISEEVGAPNQVEVRQLRDHIESQNPNAEFRMLRRIDVYEQLALRNELPQADANGFIFLPDDGGGSGGGGGRYGSRLAWSRELGISSSCIQSRTEGITGITGKNASGRVLEGGYFPESIIREALSDLLTDMPQANQEGFFLQEEAGTNCRYASISAWANLLQISQIAIARRLEGIKGITGKASGGQVLHNGFYSEPIVREKCAVLLETLSQADDTGFFIEDGERHTTMRTWSSELGISESALSRRLENVAGKKGRDSRGRFFENGFYSESVVRGACDDLLKEVSRAGEDGSFFLKAGEVEERFATVEAWARLLNVSKNAIKNRTTHLKGLTGKSSTGLLLENAFYAESEMRNACADLLQEMPSANEDGFVTLKVDSGESQREERYATSGTWASLWNIPRSCIMRRLKNLPNIRARDGRARIQFFYSESIVRDACTDLLQAIPKADENGFFMNVTSETDQENVERFATLQTWSKHLDISAPAITRRMQGKVGISGKTSVGIILEDAFYPESVVKNACADLLQEMPKADENGFFLGEIKDGDLIKVEVFATLKTWSKELKISDATLYSRFNGTKGMSGRTSNGNICIDGFYPESVARECCKDLLENVPTADKNGFFLHVIGENVSEREERFATVVTWAKLLGVSRSTILKRLEGRNGIDGRDQSGNIRRKGFYSESDINAACSDLLQNLPQADQEGFFNHINNGQEERFALIRNWERVFGISVFLIKKALGNREGITAKNISGKVFEKAYYAESIIRTVCADLIAQKIKEGTIADENNK
jgi:superfamily II DNA or RNA helicase/AraC-like DNA-binding protein